MKRMTMQSNESKIGAKKSRAGDPCASIVDRGMADAGAANISDEPRIRC
jgi:hypothetical protein